MKLSRHFYLILVVLVSLSLVTPAYATGPIMQEGEENYERCVGGKLYTGTRYWRWHLVRNDQKMLFQYQQRVENLTYDSCEGGALVRRYDLFSHRNERVDFSNGTWSYNGHTRLSDVGIEIRGHIIVIDGETRVNDLWINGERVL